jgi:predicted CXXCH cytochrome family protein
MQIASAETVLGDFRDTTFRAHGVSTRFWRRDGKYLVTTDGPDGKPGDYEVEYVFGVSPLQQVLLELPGGRLQALSVAWDSLRGHWFHLYPRERIVHRDELHWTKPSQNWNFMCAECHSTGVQKRYDRDRDRYETRWFQIDVGCQACHGPGSAHVKWAQGGARSAGGGAAAVGLEVDPRATNGSAQLDACGRCHSRRSVIAPEYRYGRPLMDSHFPALLAEGLYHADGQIQDEVYEYGSFLQSRMAQAGVRCTDCHDPHGGALKDEGNALCTRCHGPRAVTPRPGIVASGLTRKDYDSREHHFHVPGSPGSRCIECHAPRKTYMVVDPRADHGFRIPRPDLSARLGTPNACNGCHRERSPQWAAREIERRHPGYQPRPHYAEALAAGRRAAPGAVAALKDVVTDRDLPAIVRATAIELLGRYPGALSDALVASAIRDPDPLVRHATVVGLRAAPRARRSSWLPPLLRDPVLAVRIEAARALADLPEFAPSGADGAAFNAALAELEASYRVNEDRAEGRSGLGWLHGVRGRTAEAESDLRSALAYDPVPVSAVVNLADFYRATGREPQAEKLLRDALSAHPGNPALVRALALSLVRQRRKVEALRLLATAPEATPDNAYVYALALDDAGRGAEAIHALERAVSRWSGSRDLLLALASLYARAGERARAAECLRSLASVNPDDPAVGAPPVEAPPGR